MPDVSRARKRPFMLKRLFIICSLLVFHDYAISQILEQRKRWEFEKWPQMFKDRAFCLCLMDGYKDSTIKNAFVKDKSYFEPIAIAIFDKSLNGIINQEVKSIDQKEKDSYSRVSEAAAGRKVLYHCLDFYRSKRLDLLLKATKPQWYKIQNIDSLIDRSIPAF